MVEDVAEVVVEEDGAVGGDVSIGAGGELVFETDVEGFDVEGDGGGNAPDAVKVGEVLSAFHIYMITIGGGVEQKVLPCPEVFHVAQKEVAAHLLAIGDIQVADGGTQWRITPRAVSVDGGDAIADKLIEV